MQGYLTTQNSQIEKINSQLEKNYSQGQNPTVHSINTYISTYLGHYSLPLFIVSTRSTLIESSTLQTNANYKTKFFNASSLHNSVQVVVL